MAKQIETERLLLRAWRAEDIEPYYQINQDAKVIEYLRGALSLNEAEQFINKTNGHLEQRGYTLWAVELKSTAELLGFIGLNYADWEAAFTPAVEIGWRLGSQYWGKGYATEGARACLDFAFNQVGLDEVVSFTVPMNKKSIAVMERIGMRRDMAGDFCHPKLALDHPLSKHILYRISRDSV